MNVQETIHSDAFNAQVTNALRLSAENDFVETGFCCWSDSEGVLTVNEPVTGGASSIGDSMQGDGERVDAPGTGYYVAEGGEVAVSFHSHPLTRDQRRIMVAPSISDVLFVTNQGRINMQVAEMHGRSDWINPVAVIGSARRPDRSYYQVASSVIGHELRAGELARIEGFRVAIGGLYTRLYPEYATNGTSVKAQAFGPDGIWSPNWGTPAFLLQGKRYQGLLESMDVRLELVDHDASAGPLLAGFEVKPIAFPDSSYDNEEDMTRVDELDVTDDDEGWNKWALAMDADDEHRMRSSGY